MIGNNTLYDLFYARDIAVPGEIFTNQIASLPKGKLLSLLPQWQTGIEQELQKMQEEMDKARDVQEEAEASYPERLHVAT